VRRFLGGGFPISLHTSGFNVDEESAAWMGQLVSSIHVSVDGADAATHDFIRGRQGSFEEAMRALCLLDRLAAQRTDGDGRPIEFGIDFSVVQSNFHQIERLCAEVTPRFPHLRFLSFGAAVPSGLASREGYAELELLSEEQLAVLRDRDFRLRLLALAPAVAQVSVSDNLELQMHPDRCTPGSACVNVMQIEPDGQVRAMPIYEGTVGNILEDSPEVIWRRAQEHRHDAFVVRELSTVRTMRDWARAARNIDRHFASSAELVRISRREEYTGRVHRNNF